MLHDIAGKGRSLNNGYECVYLPKHPNARVNGYVYVHRIVMENSLGRYLDSDEHIHHLDGNKTNNQLSNLELTTASEHAKKHKGEVKPRKCATCQRSFRPEKNGAEYCSLKCSAKSQERADWPSDEKLSLMVWDRPSSEISRELGVSDSALAKRCRLRGIKKPSRGYWQKKLRM